MISVQYVPVVSFAALAQVARWWEEASSEERGARSVDP
jgi:hypothetical protein